MELEQLRQLVEVERCGTISAAAEELHMTQPSLSRSIRRLERHLGQDLFDCGHNSVMLNEAGRLALTHAKRILADVRLMRNDFDELSKHERTIRIASVEPAPAWRLTALVVERFPGTILGSELMGEAAVQEALAIRDCDLAIVRRPIALPTVRSVPLMTEDLYASIPAGNPLAGRPSVSFEELDGQPFLLYEDIGSWRGIVNEHLASSRIVVMEDHEMFMQMLRTSELLAFTSSAPENTGGQEGRVRVPISDADAHATFFLVCLADAKGQVADIFDWVVHERG